ncbi:MAG: Lpg1974 family pore-forming outer membrane protein [Planctomycetales bacterium]|jgi:hypothetical protein
MRESKTLSPTRRYVTSFVVACQIVSFGVARADEPARTVRPHESTLFDQIQDDLARGASHWTADSATLPQQVAFTEAPFSTTPFDDDNIGHASFEESVLAENPIGQGRIEQTSYSSLAQLSQPVAPQLVPATLGRSTSREGFNIAVGFDFLQPSWSNDSFQQLLPGTTAALFPGLNLDSTVDHDYGLSPRIDVGLALGSSEYGISAGVNTVNLSGSIRQNTAGMATNDSIDAQSAINILSVNLPEVSRVIPLDIYEDDQIDDAIFELRVGARYSSINQLFTAALRQGSGSAVTSSSFQDFRGVGLTAAGNLSLPVTNSLWLYGNSRGSMLLGRNERQANYSVLVAGAGGVPAAGTASNTVTEDKTDIIPVGEFEGGFVWDLAEQFCDEDSDPGNMVWFKLGYVAQVWGDVGLTSAGTGQPFRDGSLFLQGFTVQAGVAY